MVDDDPNELTLVHGLLQHLAPSLRFQGLPPSTHLLTQLCQHPEHHPTALLLDLHMPGLMGLDFLRILRSAPAGHALPVVVLTASDDPTDLHAAQMAGATAVHQKPASPDAYKALLAHLLAQLTSHHPASH